MQKRTFDEWKSVVDQEIEKLCGMSADDLSDWDYWQSWDDGESPKHAATKAVKNSLDMY